MDPLRVSVYEVSSFSKEELEKFKQRSKSLPNVCTIFYEGEKNGRPFLFFLLNPSIKVNEFLRNIGHPPKEEFADFTTITIATVEVSLETKLHLMPRPETLTPA